MEDQLPADRVWSKTKIGFEPPQAAWMGNLKVMELIQEGRRVLVNKGVLKRGVLDKNSAAGFPCG